jgi:competence protein ComEC
MNMANASELRTPSDHEDFLYKDYLDRQSIYSYVNEAEVTRLPGNNGNIITAQFYKLRLKLLENTYRLFRDPEAPLFAGILFGVDSGLPKKLQEAFKNTGMIHTITISGFKSGIIAVV